MLGCNYPQLFWLFLDKKYHSYLTAYHDVGRDFKEFRCQPIFLLWFMLGLEHCMYYWWINTTPYISEPVYLLLLPCHWSLSPSTGVFLMQGQSSLWSQNTCCIHPTTPYTTHCTQAIHVFSYRVTHRTFDSFKSITIWIGFKYYLFGTFNYTQEYFWELAYIYYRFDLYAKVLP